VRSNFSQCLLHLRCCYRPFSRGCLSDLVGLAGLMIDGLEDTQNFVSKTSSGRSSSEYVIRAAETSTNHHALSSSLTLSDSALQAHRNAARFADTLVISAYSVQFASYGEVIRRKLTNFVAIAVDCSSSLCSEYSMVPLWWRTQNQYLRLVGHGELLL
jgi:hypothetical protein